MTLKWNEEHTSRQSDQIEVQGLEPDLLRNYENKFYVAGEKNRGDREFYSARPYPFSSGHFRRPDPRRSEDLRIITMLACQPLSPCVTRTKSRRDTLIYRFTFLVPRLCYTLLFTPVISVMVINGIVVINISFISCFLCH